MSETTFAGNLQELLASIVESAADAIISLDTNGTVITWNASAARLFGYSATQMIGRPYREILTGWPLEDFTDLFRRTMAGESVSQYETTRQRRDGSTMDVELSLAPIVASDGSIIGKTSIVHEITERKCRERERVSILDLLERAQHVAHIGGWTAGLAPTAPLTITSETSRILGMPERSGLTTADFYDRVHPDDLEHVQEAINTATTPEGHFELEHRIVRPDGTERWVLEAASMVSDENGTPVEMIGVVQDITERHESEVKIRGDERQLRLLVENSRDLSFYYRILPDRAYEFVSPACLAITGYTPAELYENPELKDAIFAAASQRATSLRLSSGHGQEVVESQITRKDGSTLWVSQLLNAVSDPSGNIIAVEGIIRDISERKESEARSTHDALHDSLTGLANLDLLMDRIRHGLSRAVGANSCVAVLLVDLDRFKLINDTHGHGGGDAVLMAVAERLTLGLGLTQTVARMSGDEFVVLCEDLNLAIDAIKIAEHVLDIFNTAFEIDGEEVFVKASIGVATARAGGTSQINGVLLHDAELAMYQAKDRGGGRYEVFEPSLRVDAERRSIEEAGIRRAIQDEEFAMVFQPVWSIAQECFVGAEALLRWHDPARGTISPGEFISVAEDSGLIIPIGHWVLQQSFAALAQWSRMGPLFAACTMSINVSPVQLRSRTFPEEIERLIAATGVDPKLLCLEITESVLMEDDDNFSTTLHRLRSLGVQFSIDDFGTGYSSLGYLRRFPVDEVKIDQSFIKGLGRDPFATALVKAVIMIGDALGLRVVAEGVENVIQLTKLRELGGQHAQGYLFARPCELEACSAVIAEGRYYHHTRLGTQTSQDSALVDSGIAS